MWKLESPHAQLVAPFGSCQLDLSRPELGLCQWRLSPVTVAEPELASAQLLQACLPGDGPLEEAFTRGDDLVALYGLGNDQIRCQVYWRQLAAPSVSGVRGGVEMLLAVQTQLLDCHPRLSVATQFGPGTQLEPSPSQATFPGWVFRPPGIELSYVELVYPADLASSQIEGLAGTGVRSHLRLDSMEKGVIRCCRVRGWWVSRACDRDVIERLGIEFVESPLPLTA